MPSAPYKFPKTSIGGGWNPAEDNEKNCARPISNVYFGAFLMMFSVAIIELPLTCCVRLPFLFPFPIKGNIGQYITNGHGQQQPCDAQPWRCFRLHAENNKRNQENKQPEPEIHRSSVTMNWLSGKRRINVPWRDAGGGGAQKRVVRHPLFPFFPGAIAVELNALSP